MKRPSLVRDLVPVNEFRANVASWVRQLAESGRSVVTTQHGRAAAVLVEPSVLDELDEAREVVRKVAAGLEDIQAGRIHEDKAVWAEIGAIIEAAESADPKD
jgi:PHD/YefM family antitoxin component YafN of YafNO toxin-antitoxin module